MPKISAGLLMYRVRAGQVQVLLIHPGGPFWTHKDAGAWSIPKGELGEGEEMLAAAQREFEEETGVHPAGPFLALRPITQRSGKIVHAWAFEGDCDPAACRSNLFNLEWPPHSGTFIPAPEADRAEFFTLDEARRRINPSQVPLLEELASRVQPGAHSGAGGRGP